MINEDNSMVVLIQFYIEPRSSLTTFKSGLTTIKSKVQQSVEIIVSGHLRSTFSRPKMVESFNLKPDVFIDGHCILVVNNGKRQK